MSDRIVLVGAYASGKTTLGKRLAAHLQWTFLDSDEVLGDARELHITLGEEAFREREEEVLKELLQQTECVIATGGGAVVSPNTRLLLKEARPIYLHVSEEELWSRWQTRGFPHFTRSRSCFERYLEERLPLYEEIADRVVHADDLDGIACQLLPPELYRPYSQSRR